MQIYKNLALNSEEALEKLKDTSDGISSVLDSLGKDGYDVKKLSTFAKLGHF